MSATGHVKRNPATGSVAMRTGFDESIPELAPMAWAVINIGVGPRRMSSADVADWDDLYVPEDGS